MSVAQSPIPSPRPFAAAPDPCRFFPANAMDEARQRIGRSILRGEGPVLVIGAAGLGKTMLLEVVAQQFREQLGSVLLLGGQLCTRRALLQMILFQLSLPYKAMDESELRLSLLSYLQPQDAAARRILLLVDEADALPQRLLEELRSLTNLSGGGQMLVNLVLAGNSTLEEQLADPKLELFSQRISARCYLSTFGREETFQYVCAQVAAAGIDPQSLFTNDGLEAVFAATDGVPRLVNQLGDQLMWMVAETGCSPLDGLIVQQAWSELQQLPAPWNTQTSEPIGGPVEFGELTDDATDDATELDELVFEDDGYEVDNDFDAADDLPASIPIGSSQPIVEEDRSTDLNFTETIDVTEQLVEQLQVMGAAQHEEDVQLKAESATRNPFNETFDSEEIVLDRYSTFESLLLAEAPRVVNCSDTAFAQQLQQLETVETVVDVPQSGVTIDTAEPESFYLSTDEPAIPAVGAPEFHNPKFTDEPGDILVIEESEQTQTTVVTGRKFRQLFSSLETGSCEPCYG